MYIISTLIPTCCVDQIRSGDFGRVSKSRIHSLLLSIFPTFFLFWIDYHRISLLFLFFSNYTLITRILIIIISAIIILVVIIIIIIIIIIMIAIIIIIIVFVEEDDNYLPTKTGIPSILFIHNKTIIISIRTTLFLDIFFSVHSTISPYTWKKMLVDLHEVPLHIPVMNL